MNLANSLNETHHASNLVRLDLEMQETFIHLRGEKILATSLTPPPHSLT